MSRDADTPDVLELRAQLLSTREELRQAREHSAEASAAHENLNLLLGEIRDYAFIALDPDSRIMAWSEGAVRIFRMTAADVLGQPSSIIFTPEDRARGADLQEVNQARTTGRAEDERWHIRGDGTKFWGSGILTAHLNPDGSPRMFSKVLRDLTERQTAADRLREALEKFRLFTESVRDYALFSLDAQGTISGWNTGAERIFGYLEQEVAGRHFALLLTPDDAGADECDRDLSTALVTGRYEGEAWMVRKDASRFWARWVTTAMRDADGTHRGYAKVLRDETESRLAADRMNASLIEKEALIREIHHRVRNNLQFISSLVSIQSSRLTDGQTRELFGELGDRVHAIATLHEAAYRSPGLAEIRFRPYLEQLTMNLRHVHYSGLERVDLRVQCDDVVLPLAQALPLALIVTELISGTLRRFLHEDQAGTVDAVFRGAPNGMYEFFVEHDGRSRNDSASENESISDNGSLSDNGFISDNDSIGPRIVQLLAKQLHGKLTDHGRTARRVSVVFPA